MSIVVLDTDFLSSFLKIEKLELIRDFFRTDQFLIPLAVYREIAMTALLPELAAIDWIQIREVDVDDVTELAEDREYSELGSGEKEAIALANRVSNGVLLMSDKRAGRYARGIGIVVVDIPAFLLAWRRSGETTPEEIQGLVEALQEKDHYGFSESVLRQILQS